MSFVEAATRESNNQLQVLVAAGDDAARTRMIESNMRLAAFNVERFVSRRPQYAYIKDDLLSEAFVGLTVGVNNIRDKGLRDDPTSWLAGCINKKLLKAVERLTKDIAVNRNVDKIPSDTASDVEVREALDACCEDDTDVEIIRLREQGYSDAEIGASIGRSRLFVTRTRRRLAENFKKV